MITELLYIWLGTCFAWINTPHYDYAYVTFAKLLTNSYMCQIFVDAHFVAFCDKIFENVHD